MADIDNFRQLLQYFVAHLEFCEANRINTPKWTAEERNKNISPSVTTTRGFNDYLAKYNYKWGNEFNLAGQGYNGNGIQKQIKGWDTYSGNNICITVSNGNNKDGYKNDKQNYLQWIDTDNDIRPKWNNNIIESLFITTGSKKNYKKTGDELKVLDNLYDANGNIVNSNSQKLSDFWAKYESFINKGSHSLNLILYGPPGTGKTYNTVNKALDIVEPNWRNKFKEQSDIIEEREYALQQFKYHKDITGQIVFTTFHQSMSYEDFIEGIKPIVDDNAKIEAKHKNLQSGSTEPQFGEGVTTIENLSRMKYKICPGIFKQICENAKKASAKNKFEEIDFSKTRIFKMSLGQKGKDADSIFDYCVENEVVALGWGGKQDFSSCNTKAEFKQLDPTWGATALEIFKLWMKNGDIVLISEGTKEVKGIAQIVGEYEYRKTSPLDTDIHQFRKVKWLYTGDNIPISKLYDKNLSQQSIYCFYNEKKGVVDNGGIKIDVLNEIITGKINDKKDGNYVLIIDEINRGNVSQIFGELITLIEKDKRIGEKEELRVKLPYSSSVDPNAEQFGVPNNLYIIGTMNTADRSVEALDTALRRRFSFEEMMPKPGLLKDVNNQDIKVCDVELCNLLETINKRIVALKDREHQIGHSYFMDDCLKGTDEKAKEKWLAKVFKDKIIPLLQEYFYGDYKKIYYVLGGSKIKGEGFVKIDSVTKSDIFAVKIEEDYDYDIPEMRYEIQTIDETFDIKKAIGIMMKKEAPSGIIEETK